MDTKTEPRGASSKWMTGKTKLMVEFIMTPAWRLGLVACCVFLTVTLRAAELKPQSTGGLMLTFRTDSETDVSSAQGVALYVPAGRAPSPFVAPGPFTATWEGQLAVDLRGDFTFHAVSSGALKIEANGASALETSGSSASRVPGKPVRLNKGPNTFKVTFTSPAQEDSILRLYWSSDEFPAEPVTPDAFRFNPTSEFEKASLIHTGRELFLDFRCAKCHPPDNLSSGVPELQSDAPTFEGIGSRRNAAWMSQWVTNPQILRASARMPSILHGESAVKEAESIAAFLATLSSGGARGTEPASSVPESIEAGKKHFEAFHCVACHQNPGATETVPVKISLSKANDKFSSGALASFLRSPTEHYQWIRMPDFKLTVQESANLAAFLTSQAEPKANGPLPAPSPALIGNGKKLVQTRGCLNCHTLKIENRFASPTLAGLKLESFKMGCLAATTHGGSKAPRFSFTEIQRAALVAFLSTDKSSLQRHVPNEFAARSVRHLNCIECHGKFDGFPPLESLGGKLKPEWTKQFIAGEIHDKPRPWIVSRMPAFKAWAEGLATGLAHSHGFPAITPAEGAIDAELTKIGQKLVSADGGFSCISCHGVASLGPTQVFESVGINLALSSERLQPEYYRRWLTNPLRIDPQTKMPLYFDQGKSPLTELLEGDAAKQLDAIWQYIRLGNKMPPPTAIPNGRITE